MSGKLYRVLVATSFVGLWGCPGTLADPGAFEAAADLPMEAGAPAEDASPSPRVEDASPSQDVGAPVNDARAEASGPPPEVDAGCGVAVPTAVFAPICAQVGCHNASSHIEGLDLSAPIALAALVNQPVIEVDAGLLLINSAHPTQSAIYTKLGASPPFGVQMPYGMAPLSADEMQCVLEWIEQQVGD